MVAVLIVSILFALVAAGAVFLAYRQRLFFWRLKEAENENAVPLLSPVALFAVPNAETLAKIEQDERHQLLMAEREKLFAWASLVDFTHLPDAPLIGDAEHLQTAFHILSDRAETDEEISALVAFTLKHNNNPNVNHNLINKYLQIWQSSPNFGKTANLFQLAVLANDADLFLSVLVEAEQAVKTGGLSELTSSELYELAESHYWLLPEAARISGAGFLLKQKLASLRCEITDHHTRRN